MFPSKKQHYFYFYLKGMAKKYSPDQPLKLLSSCFSLPSTFDFRHLPAGPAQSIF